MSLHDCEKWRDLFNVRVYGIPKAQPRARAFAMKIGGKFSARMYDAGTAEAWKSDIARAFEEFQLVPIPSGPVRATITFIFPRPKSHYRTGKHAGFLKPDMPTFHSGKPDRDNCEKAVLDCLTRLGFWGDDGQVCAGEVVKVYANPLEQPGAQIIISVPAEVK